MNNSDHSYNSFIQRNGNELYVKFVNEQFISIRKFQYHLGFSHNTEKFNPSGSCKNGGLYFTKMQHASAWKNYGSYMAVLKLSPNFEYYTEPCGSKFKSDKLDIVCFIKYSDLPENAQFNSSEKLIEFCREHDICMIDSAFKIVVHFLEINKRIAPRVFKHSNEVQQIILDEIHMLEKKSIIPTSYNIDHFIHDAYEIDKNDIIAQRNHFLVEWFFKPDLNDYNDFCIYFENPIMQTMTEKDIVFLELLTEFNCGMIKFIPDNLQTEKMCMNSVRKNSSMLQFCKHKTVQVVGAANSQYPGSSEKNYTSPDFLEGASIIDQIIHDQHLFFKYRFKLGQNDYYSILSHHGWLIIYLENPPIDLAKIAIEQKYSNISHIRRPTRELMEFAKTQRTIQLRRYYDMYMSSK
jgi:hypothetical protein